MCRYKPSNLYEFVYNFYMNAEFTEYIEGLNALLENYRISPGNLSISQNANYNILPMYTWEGNNKDVKSGSLTFKFSNTEFVLEFYTLSGELLFETDKIYDNKYTLLEKQWSQILLSDITSYKVRVRGYSPYGSLTGPYYSSFYVYNKPNDEINIVNVNISNLRYYENSIVIMAKTVCQFNITFDHSGNKLFQTFGKLDTKMKLYDSSNMLVVPENDDSGYENNSLIFVNLNSNTTYKLLVSLVDNTITASTKLAIISYGGDYPNNNSSITSYEKIHKIDFTSQRYTYHTNVNQHEATVVIWKPNVTGCYTIELCSDFDNYLYVIDPDSSDYLVYDVDCNDDYYIDEDQGLYTSNAKLYGYYSSNKTYMIVINQNIPSENGGNISLIIGFLR